VVPHWKKLAYSFASAMVGGATLVGLLFGLADKTPAQYFVSTPGVSFAGAFAVWVIAIPLILLVNNVSGWRLWLYLGIGSISVPIIVFVGLLALYIKYPTQLGHAQITAKILATLILLGIFAIPSSAGALTYLLLLQKAQKSAQRRMNLPSVE
jgi:hypothetical protein